MSSTNAQPGGHAREAQAAKRVSWIEGVVPDSEEAQLVFEAVTHQGLTALEDVVRYLANALYWRDFLHGGWATDIGLLRALGIYRRDANEALWRLAGDFVRIE